MLQRFWAWCKTLPLFRLGTALVILGAMVDGLDALGAIDLSTLIPAGHDAGKIIAAIGVAKIVLRGVLMVATALTSKEPVE
jgi:hypothetical protein